MPNVQISFPLCTIAHTPRLPEHCIEYARLLQWPKENPFGEDVAIDGDDPNHVISSLFISSLQLPPRPQNLPFQSLQPTLPILYSTQLTILILFSFFITRFPGSTRRLCSEPTNMVYRSLHFCLLTTIAQALHCLKCFYFFYLNNFVGVGQHGGIVLFDRP